MGRPKTYDRDEIIERAMRLFWERGYHATSTRDLTETMGVNPYSLYAEFGSKKGLYEAAIARYELRVVHSHLGKLEADGASLEAVRALLDFFGDSGGQPGSELGCLLCNASTELAPTLAGSRASTARFVERITRAFAKALGNAAAAGRLKESAPVDELAAHFATQLIGMFVLLRAQVDATVVRAAADQALTRLDEETVR